MQILYGWDDIAGQREVIVVEGELDKLSLEEAGFLSVASIPEGAPARVQPGPLPNPAEDTKFTFLWNRYHFWPCLPLMQASLRPCFSPVSSEKEMGRISTCRRLH